MSWTLELSICHFFAWIKVAEIKYYYSCLFACFCWRQKKFYNRDIYCFIKFNSILHQHLPWDRSRPLALSRVCKPYAFQFLFLPGSVRYKMSILNYRFSVGVIMSYIFSFCELTIRQHQWRICNPKELLQSCLEWWVIVRQCYHQLSWWCCRFCI